jgi:hypothetical protein
MKATMKKGVFIWITVLHVLDLVLELVQPRTMILASIE